MELTFSMHCIFLDIKHKRIIFLAILALIAITWLSSTRHFDYILLKDNIPLAKSEVVLSMHLNSEEIKIETDSKGRFRIPSKYKGHAAFVTVSEGEPEEHKLVLTKFKKGITTLNLKEDGMDSDWIYRFGLYKSQSKVQSLSEAELHAIEANLK